MPSFPHQFLNATNESCVMPARFIFVPVVTQLQLALDMALSFGAPSGHGHAYCAHDYIAPWVEMTDPEDWSLSDTEKLMTHCDNGFQMGCSNGLK